MPDIETPEIRMDKWLWCVRIYRSRSVATAACNTGKVRIDGQPVKPSRSVRMGETITAVAGDLTRTVKVTGLLDRRVGAKIAAQYMEDLTPASEYLKPRQPDYRPILIRPPGSGRPTKKDRRAIDNLGLE